MLSLSDLCFSGHLRSRFWGFVEDVDDLVAGSDGDADADGDDDDDDDDGDVEAVADTDDESIGLVTEVGSVGSNRSEGLEGDWLGDFLRFGISLT